MTCNQLITLLQIYRGGKLSQIECGTTSDDLRWLRRMGFIETESEGLRSLDLEWIVTVNGGAKIQALLTLLV